MNNLYIYLEYAHYTNYIMQIPDCLTISSTLKDGCDINRFQIDDLQKQVKSQPSTLGKNSNVIQINVTVQHYFPSKCIGN